MSAPGRRGGHAVVCCDFWGPLPSPVCVGVSRPHCLCPSPGTFGGSLGRLSRGMWARTLGSLPSGEPEMNGLSAHLAELLSSRCRSGTLSPLVSLHRPPGMDLGGPGFCPLCADLLCLLGRWNGACQCPPPQPPAQGQQGTGPAGGSLEQPCLSPEGSLHLPGPEAALWPSLPCPAFTPAGLGGHTPLPLPAPPSSPLASVLVEPWSQSWVGQGSPALLWGPEPASPGTPDSPPAKCGGPQVPSLVPGMHGQSSAEVGTPLAQLWQMRAWESPQGWVGVAFPAAGRGLSAWVAGLDGSCLRGCPWITQITAITKVIVVYLKKKTHIFLPFGTI